MATTIPGPEAFGASIEVSADHPRAALSRDVADAMAAVPDTDNGIQLWLTGVREGDDELVAPAGLEPYRDLQQLRCALPAAPSGIETRPFDADLDAEAFIAVNNRAFAWHPEQSGMDLKRLESAMASEWFDADGFRLYELEGRLAGFCWTKVHPPRPAEGEPALGEIYVIAIDPDFHGRGLGVPMTLAGLEWLADAGLDTGMLYVEGDNHAALKTYERIGFTLHSTNRVSDCSMTDGPRSSTPGLYDVDRGELTTMLADQPSYRIDQVWEGLYRNHLDPGDMTNVPKVLRDRLEDSLPTSLTEASRRVTDAGDTVKWLWSLGDGSTIETVLMHYDERSTICLSSQAGCAMGCGFCATGQAGFDRQLTTGEIVEQAIRAIREAAPRRVSNVVFMGMGEPMANYDAVWAAVERLQGDIGISARHLTISTVGIVPGIRRMAAESLPVSLAVSLHAANDELRNRLVPINKRYPLGELMEACADHLAVKRRRLSFEWALIADTNDRDQDAYELAQLARAVRAHVNLIPLNPTPGYAVRGSSPVRVRAFRDELVALGVNATIRKNRGTEIDAACGQLRAEHEVKLSKKR